MSRSNPTPEWPKKARAKKDPDAPEPGVIVTRTSKEFMEVLSRAASGVLVINGLAATSRNGTWKFHVTKPTNK